MNTSKSYFSYLYTTTQERLDLSEDYEQTDEYNRYTTFIVSNFKRFAEDVRRDDVGKKRKYLAYSRNHPFLQDWKAWRAVVSNYFSEGNNELTAAIIAYIDSNGIMRHKLKDPCLQEFFSLTLRYIDVLLDGDKNEHEVTCRWCVDSTCNMDSFHQRMKTIARIILFLQRREPFVFRGHMLSIKRMYYIRLIKVVLSIYWNPTFYLDDDLLIPNSEILKLTPNLLLEVYSRADRKSVV